MLSFIQHKNVRDLIRKVQASSYGVLRQNMPQIVGSKFDDFKNFLKDNRVHYYEKDIIPRDYKATQKDFNVQKVLGMVTKGVQSDNNKRPILVSKDGYILDGHHRWLAHYVSDNIPLRALEINLPIKALLDLLYTYDDVEYKAVNEQQQNNP